MGTFASRGNDLLGDLEEDRSPVYASHANRDAHDPYAGLDGAFGSASLDDDEEDGVSSARRPRGERVRLMFRTLRSNIFWRGPAEESAAMMMTIIDKESDRRELNDPCGMHRLVLLLL